MKYLNIFQWSMISIVFLFVSSASAETFDTNWITGSSNTPPSGMDLSLPKTVGNIFQVNEFNALVKTLSNIYNDNQNSWIGIGTDTPTQALDIGSGDLRIRNLGEGLVSSDSNGVLSNRAGCSPDQILKWKNNTWKCATDNSGGSPSSTEAELETQIGGINIFTENDGIALDDDDLSDNTLSDLMDVTSLPCSTNQILKWDGSWICGTDSIVTLSNTEAELETQIGGVNIFTENDGIALDDDDLSDDKLSSLENVEICGNNDAFLQWNQNSSTWICALEGDADPTNEIQKLTFNESTKKLILDGSPDADLSNVLGLWKRDVGNVIIPDRSNNPVRLNDLRVENDLNVSHSLNVGIGPGDGLTVRGFGSFTEMLQLTGGLKISNLPSMTSTINNRLLTLGDVNGGLNDLTRESSIIPSGKGYVCYDEGVIKFQTGICR